jgi:DNA polymerase
VTHAERRAALEAIADEVRTCKRCRLHEGRTTAVPGEGNPDTEVFFVGEGPGFNEDRKGRPFVGRAGDLLVKLLASIGWRREDVFITNIVKCRPPENRDPESDEIAACAPFLRRQLEALEPALVVTLGRHSMGRFMPGSRIGQVHGTFQAAPAGAGADDALVYAMYHPAAALRTPQIERVSYDDMAGVPLALLEARRRQEHVVGEEDDRVATASPTGGNREPQVPETEAVAVQTRPAEAEPRAAEPRPEPASAKPQATQPVAVEPAATPEVATIAAAMELAAAGAPDPAAENQMTLF